MVGRGVKYTSITVLNHLFSHSYLIRDHSVTGGRRYLTLWKLFVSKSKDITDFFGQKSLFIIIFANVSTVKSVSPHMYRCFMFWLVQHFIALQLDCPAALERIKEDRPITIKDDKGNTNKSIADIVSVCLLVYTLYYNIILHLHWYQLTLICWMYFYKV